MIKTRNRWKHTIKVGHIHRAYQDGTLPLFELCGKVAKLVEKVKSKYPDDSEEWFELDEIEGYFVWEEDDFNEEGITIDDYDCWLSTLYDWGDYGNRLWVDSFSKA